MFVRTESGAAKDVDIASVTKENYIVPESEKSLYHVVMENKKYDEKTGVKISRPRLQKFNVPTFKKLRSNFERQGFEIVVIYDPTEYIKTFGEKIKTANDAARQKAISDAVNKAVAEANAKKDAEIQAAVDAAVKKALPEMATKKQSNNSKG